MIPSSLTGRDLYDIEVWRSIEAALVSTNGLPCITHKIEIAGHDLYVHTGWLRGQIVRIDMTLSRSNEEDDGLPVSPRQATMEATRFDLARSWLENTCHFATMLLQTGQVSLETVLAEWRGMEGYPSGLCRQLQDPDSAGAQLFVRGPTDAAARLIQQRWGTWRATTDAMAARASLRRDSVAP